MMEESDKIWKQFELLLEEAVAIDHCAGVNRLLCYESGDLMKNIHRNQPKTHIPLILAVENKNVTIVNIFRKYQYTIPEPHASNCRCKNCKKDKLGQTRYRLLTLKALSNPVWIALVSDDPFLALFQLSQLNENFKSCNDSFQKEYNEMQKENEKLCFSLLDEVRTESEGATIMRHKTIDEEDDEFSLSFINLAVDYRQKEVVAHSVVQHFLTASVFEEIPYWETSGIIYKIFLVLLIAVLWPITTVLNIVCPSRRCKTLGDIATKPFVKFINGAASFITFLLLLAVLGTFERKGIRKQETPTAVEILVFVWLLGFCFGECKQVYSNGVTEYFSDGWNWVDIGMDGLMLFAFVTWAALGYYDDQTFAHRTTMDIADGAFTLAIIFSFFRALYLCQITSYLGLLQLCLGEMIMVIVQFAFICIIVLLGFTVGMIFLFHASESGEQFGQEFIGKQHANHSVIYEILTENFNGFWSTLVTMTYVSFTMRGPKILNVFEDGSLIHLWSNMLFIAYFGITMIIVLNILIALMNNSYQKIAENLTTEHLYSRTKLWLEYVGAKQMRPVPFNLIPNGKKLISRVQRIYNPGRYGQVAERNANLKDKEQIKYKEVCDDLMERYLRKTFGFSLDDHMLLQDKQEYNENDPFLQKLNDHFKIWSSIQQRGVKPSPETATVITYDANKACKDTRV